MPRGLHRLLLPIAGRLALQALLVGVYRARRHSRPPRRATVHAESLDGREAAPGVTIRRLDGAAVDLAALRGRFVLVHFWASWCAPCRRELPAFVTLGRALARDRALALVLVATRDDASAVRRFWGGHVPAEVALDGGGDAARRFGVRALPETFLVSPEGFLVTRYLGVQDWASAEAARHLAGELRRAR